MANDDIYMVTCDGKTIQHAMTKEKAYAFAEQMQQQADYSYGTKIRASEFQVKRDGHVIREDDVLYKAHTRRTLVVR